MMLGDHSYKVPRPGNILYLAGEDSSSDLKRRISSIPDSFYIDTTKPQLDTQSGRHELIGAIGHLHPRLLVIDPFVRFHSTSENHITPMLHFLRGLATPVILVHHMAKGKTGGQGLRGSGDLHAWGDSNIYTISSSKLQVEFRHAPGRVIGRNKGASLSLIDRIKR
jgi:RecA-family ATPase